MNSKKTTKLVILLLSTAILSLVVFKVIPCRDKVVSCASSSNKVLVDRSLIVDRVSQWHEGEYRTLSYRWRVIDNLPNLNEVSLEVAISGFLSEQIERNEFISSLQQDMEIALGGRCQITQLSVGENYLWQSSGDRQTIPAE